MNRTEMKNGNLLKKVCIRLKGALASPLLAGSGENEQTDNDVIMDRSGRAFVPGSSLAGAFRHFLNEGSTCSRAAAIEALFGGKTSLFNEQSEPHLGKQSSLIVYDLSLGADSDGRANITTRDGVRLDSYKTALDQTKYEVQVVETGTPFTIRLEWNLRHDTNRTVAQAELEQLILELIDGLYTGDLTIGAKSRRGFGQLKVKRIEARSFDYSNPKEVLDWLEWDWQGEMTGVPEQNAKWSPHVSFIPGVLARIEGRSFGYCRMQVPLAIRHTLMIRRYTGKGLGQPNEPDYEQLQMNGAAVIPGTSWTGAIRERLNMILQEMGVDQERRTKQMEALFGTLHDRKQRSQCLKASRIRIEEASVKGGHALTLTRNKIDRFTGGTVKGALYTMTPWIGGETELGIRWLRPKTEEEQAVLCGLLLWVIRDLQEGLLAVGGETAVGRGTFKDIGDHKVYLNGSVLSEDMKKAYYLAAVRWCQQTEKGAVVR
ncbi:RAMP superfamily CRISPR-associated protein [Saccharibacillus alkalitolerans]|uniref:CRISPR type III-associated protein domain-containing protein n=1 Tax=Saccharibacillus alkalitolerans TaxID=2705290 RepID=A0ABX0F283_9BACL|nr:RAMP superfamily CRISPR-associated protein [Saccharibacillus alkalitolerans]NGZ74059.1 hypothetical protein [Saccharibacillus alkalitolerans]